MKNLNKVLVFALVLAILLIAFLVSVVLKQKLVEQKQLQETQQPLNANTNQDTETTPTTNQEYTYQFITNNKEGAPMTDNTFDGKIVQTDKTTGQQTILVPSVKNAYPALKESFNKTFINLMQSQTMPYLYLTVAWMETDGFNQGLIRFDATTKKFTELKVSNYYGNMSALVAGVYADTKGAYAVSTLNPKNPTDDQTIFLLDLDNDAAKVLAKLPAGQTTNPCPIEGCLGDKLANIEWLDANTFQIDVYSTTPIKNPAGYNQAKLLEKRKFKIN